MNELSWLLYVADLSESLSTAFGWFTFLTLLFILASFAFFAAQWEEVVDRSKALANRKEATKWDDGVTDDKLDQYIIDAETHRNKAVRGVKIRTFVALAVGAIFWTTAVALPAKDTVLAIAASEMGERALNTPTAGKAFKALDAWLDKQIDPPKEEKTDEDR